MGKIEEAAREYAEYLCIGDDEIRDKVVLQAGFKAGAKWAIEEALKMKLTLFVSFDGQVHAPLNVVKVESIEKLREE